MTQVRTDLRISTTRSAAFHEYAQQYAPLGVIGGGRYWRPYPLCIVRAEGSRLWDLDGNEFIDYHAAYGPAVLGHNDPEIREAVRESLDQAVLFALPHETEIELCRRITELIPSGEKVILTCAGTEATYHAVRVARAFTGRERVIKFEGAYHGWHDSVNQSVKPALDLAGDPTWPNTVPTSAGTPHAVTELTTVLPWNNQEVLDEYLTRHGDQVACIIIEPVVHSCGVLMPADGWLEYLRSVCDQHGVILIFDEIVTGFRHDLGGVQKLYEVTPDITTFGKACANGYPISGVCGRDEIMRLIEPEGPVSYSGTFNGLLLSCVAALKTIEIMQRRPLHRHLFAVGQRVADALNDEIAKLGVPAICRNYGSVWCLYFTDADLNNFRDVAKFATARDTGIDAEFQAHMLDHGIYIQPYYANRAYISAAHTDADLDQTVEAAKLFLNQRRARIEEVNAVTVG